MFLVTGGSGYIGSHMMELLLGKGHEVVNFDLVHPQRNKIILPEASFLKTDITSYIGTRNSLKLLDGKKIDCVFHFAGLISVEESTRIPAEYFRVNAGGTLNLISCLREFTDCYKFIFSSTAAVYGNPVSHPILEFQKEKPINPYGHSKLLAEKIIQTLSEYKIKYAILRYFNASGCSSSGALGEHHQPETHIIPNILLQLIRGEQGAKFNVFGTDYKTPDGTCIRDYIHVEDLVEAHWKTYEYLSRELSWPITLNLGSGKGSSIKEVVKAVEEVTGKKISCENSERRQGDPDILLADISKAISNLSWSPKRSSLKNIIKTTYDYMRK